jgi:hypothetical protein
MIGHQYIGMRGAAFAHCENTKIAVISEEVRVNEEAGLAVVAGASSRVGRGIGGRMKGWSVVLTLSWVPVSWAGAQCVVTKDSTTLTPVFRFSI